jgi:hypothetical protein
LGIIGYKYYLINTISCLILNYFAIQRGKKEVKQRALSCRRLPADKLTPLQKKWAEKSNSWKGGKS